jgi:ABC-type polysaccharide/polyol phosphate export permease
VSTTVLTGATRRNIALLRNFLGRELSSRYLGSIAGLAWALLHPLALLAVYYMVFTQVFRVGGLGGESFLAFVAVALWPWLAAQEALQRGTPVIAAYGDLIRKVAFPHEIAVYANVGATFAIPFAGYVLVLAVLAAFGEPVRPAGLLLALPLWVVLAIGVTGITLALAALQVFIRDVEHVLMPILMVLMYLTPILYPLALVPQGLRGFVAANPLTWLVTRLRDALLEGRLEWNAADLFAAAVAFALFVGGRWVFRRLSSHFEDFV